MDKSLEYTLGQMNNQIEVLTREVQSLRQETKEINRQFSEIKGGKKALWGLLVAAATLGGLIGTVASLVVPWR